MKTFMVLPLFLILSQLNSIHSQKYNKKGKFVIVVDDPESNVNGYKNQYHSEYPSKYKNYPFNKIPDPNKMLKFQPSDARSYFWKHKLTTSTTTTEAPTTTEMPETTTEAPTTTEMPAEPTVPSVDYDLSNIPSNYPELLMFYKLCPVNITGKYNPNDIPLPQPIPPPLTAPSTNYFSQNQQQIKPSEISNQFPIGNTFNSDPFTNNYFSIYGSKLNNQLGYYGDQTTYGSNQIYANQFSNGNKNPSTNTLTTANNGIKYGPIGEIAGFEAHNYGAGSSKYIPGYLQNNPINGQFNGNQQATIYVPPTFSSSGNSNPGGQKTYNDMKDLYQNMGLQVVDLTMSNKNFQNPNGLRINKQLGIVAYTKLSPKLTAASKLIPISSLTNSYGIPQVHNQFNPNTVKNYNYANLNKNLLYFGPTDSSNKILTPLGTKIDFVNQQRPTYI